jgi:hypothetical protein
MQAQISSYFLLKASTKSDLRRIGVSYQKAIMTPCISIALRATANAMLRAGATSPAEGGKTSAAKYAIPPLS